VRLLLPYVVLALALGQTPRLLAPLLGGTYVAQNRDLEDGRILAHRQRLLRTALPSEGAVLLVGTSRTGADYSAEQLANGIAETCGVGPVSVHNLGNLANSWSAFRAQALSWEPPRALVLEFSPHTFLSDPAPATPDPFASYRQAVRAFELTLSGAARGALLVADRFEVTPETLVHAANWARTSPREPAALYYHLRLDQGYGQHLRADGQTLYWTQFPNRQAAALVAPRVRATQIEVWRSTNLAGELSASALASFKAVIEALTTSGTQVVVVRPPIDRAVYDLENRLQGGVVDLVTTYLRDTGTPYLDMNPHGYHALDLSHVDWYDTPAATSQLASWLVRTVDWSRATGRRASC
jgi:hypothetical protein